MKSPHDSNNEYHSRLAYWRTHAGLTFAVMIGVLAASSFLRVPDLRFIGTSTLAGIAIFLAWRLDPSRRLYSSLAVGLVGIGLVLLGLSVVHKWPFPIVFVQGIGGMAGAFSLCMVVWNAKD